jgi:hypothetical protein
MKTDVHDNYEELTTVPIGNVRQSKCSSQPMKWSADGWRNPTRCYAYRESDALRLPKPSIASGNANLKASLQSAYDSLNACCIMGHRGSSVEEDDEMNSRKRTVRTPLSRMLSKGGIVYVPRDAYLRRLQRLYAQANRQAHANSLYPGLAHLAATNDYDLAGLYSSILAVSEAGRNLHGLESLFLSCLQSMQLRGYRSLARIIHEGLAAAQ